MKTAKSNEHAPRARHDDLVIQEVTDEVLVYDLRQHKAHCLNRASAFVWQHCDGERTAVEIAGLMLAEFKKPVTEGDVRVALKQLSRSDLLDDYVPDVVEGERYSRRQALRRLGIAALVPAVVSIVAPRAVSAASAPVACQACRKKSEGCVGVCTDVLGRCYDNSGCGTGQAEDCVTCADCFSGLGGTKTPHLTISWKTPC